MKYPTVKIVRPRNKPNYWLYILTIILCLVVGWIGGYYRAYHELWTWGIDKEMDELRLTIKAIPIQNMRLEALVKEVESWRTEMVRIGIFAKGKKEMVIHLPVDDSEEKEKK